MAINCQNGCGGCNGCTTSVVIDQESRKYKADGMPVKLTANKNRVTNRKLRLREHSMIDKTVWYSIDYHLRLDKRPEIKNICEFEAPKDMDMKKALAGFNIRFSPDKKHFAVGLNDRVYDFFHFLGDGVPFSSGCYYLKDSTSVYLSTAELFFDKINWKVFPSPDQLLDEIIVPNSYSVWTYTHNQNNILKILDELPPGNPHDLVLIENWFCEIADLHFTQPRVEQIVKASPKWKKTAIEKMHESINNSVSENDLELDKSLKMILWINDANALEKADRLVFEEYFAAGYAGDYLIERMKNKNIVLNKNIEMSLSSTAKKIAANLGDTEEMSCQTAFDILLLKKENQVLKQFIDIYVTPDSIVNSYIDISNGTIRKFDLYPKDLKELLVKKYLVIAQVQNTELSDFDITEILEFLKDKISCRELKKLVEIHKEKLNAFRMPDGC